MPRHELDGRGFLKTTTGWDRYRIEDYVYPDDLELARTAIGQAIRDKAVFELEHRVLRADDTYGWTYSRAVPVLDADGEITEWIGSASDITERKLAELKLKETDRRKDEFLAMLAHELRNPLAPISSAAEMLGMLLEAAGHRVLLEHHPQSALARAKAETPDACLLDIGLPEMDGNELALRLRRQPETAGSVLIAVTGYGQDDNRQHGMRSGFDHYLVKPVDAARLMAILAAIPSLPHRSASAAPT